MPSRPKPPWNPRELKEVGEQLGLVTHLGLTMAAAVGIGLAAGHYLDRWLGTRGLCKAILIPLGALSGFWAVYKIIMGTGRRGDDGGPR